SPLLAWVTRWPMAATSRPSTRRRFSSSSTSSTCPVARSALAAMLASLRAQAHHYPRAAAARARAQLQPAAVLVGDRGRDRQPQPRAAPGRFARVERLQRALQLLGAEPRPLVLAGQLDPARRGPSGP